MRYLPILFDQLEFEVSLPLPFSDSLTVAQFTWLLKVLRSNQCKRMLFDARQAEVFDRSNQIDERRREKIKPPFSCFYMELTQPISLKAQEPGQHDLLHSFLFYQDIQNATEVINGGNGRRTVPVTKVTFFYRSKLDDRFVDRSWSLSPEGYPMVGRPPKYIMSRYKTPTVEGANAEGLIDLNNLPDYVQEGEMISVFDLEKLGWWEECLISNTNLIYWMFAYTMAKSVEIIEIPVSRQVRRACERDNKPLPLPYHIVKVVPKRIQRKGSSVGEDGIKHSYRYDVIGHLRFGRHKVRDGTYVETIEWVSDHMRGLDNEVYIPKTYMVEKDKRIAIPEMERYFKEA